MNARTTKDRVLSPAPLAKLGYPCSQEWHARIRIKFFFRSGAITIEDQLNDSRYSLIDTIAVSLLLGYDSIFPLARITSS